MTSPDPLEPEEAPDSVGADLDLDLDLDGDLDAGIEAGFGPRPDPLGASGGPTGFRPGVHDRLASGPPRVSLREPASQCPGPNLPAGDVVLGAALGKYELEGEIARGGIGLVLKGKDPHLGRNVAIKVLHERHRGNPVLVERFIEEAQIGGQLEHPGVVPVYELAAADGRPYFAMKLVNGRTLAELLAERKSPGDDLRRFLAILERVAQTMAYAHARGVIHRDLKPANIMVGAFGEVQVMDWGLAKVLGGPCAADSDARSCEDRSDAALRTIRSTEGSSHSVAGSVMGTPAYMPPEQARGEVERLDERADVFSFGAILCEVLTGAAPYVGKDSEVVLRLAASSSLAGARRRVAASPRRGSMRS